MPNSVKEKNLRKVNNSILECKFCLRNSKGLLVPGEGNSNADIVFIGEAPGKEEIKTGQPFVGRAGKLLRELLSNIGLDPQQVFITSAVKYLPKTYITPTIKDVLHGREHLMTQLNVIKPKIIVILGNTSALSLLDEKIYVAKTHGEVIEKDSYKYFISYHPAAPLYSPKLRSVITKDFKKLKKLISINDKK